MDMQYPMTVWHVRPGIHEPKFQEKVETSYRVHSE